MAKTPKLRLLRDKQREVDERIAATKAALAELETEAAELRIAAKVLANLSIDDEDDGSTHAPGVEHTQGAVGEPDLAVQHTDDSASIVEVKMPPPVRKPDGIPTMPEMIVTAISNSAVNGKGLEPKQMTAYISNRWWPDVPFNSVGPIAWRMYKRHELVKRGSRYYLPATKAEAAE